MLKPFAKAAALRERLAGPPSRRAAYYSLSQAAYTCLAGSFELPMAFSLAGRIDLVAFVYAFYYLTIFAGFALGLLLVREGRASTVYRLGQASFAALCLGAALCFRRMSGIPALALYFTVRGLGEGLYWSARHRAMLWSVRDSGRDRFALKLQALVVSLSVLLPLVGGFAITYLSGLLRAGGAPTALPPGYLPVFLVTGLVMLLALAFSPRFEIGRSPLSPRAILGLFRAPEAASWRVYVSVVAFAGALVGVAAGVQTFGVLKTEFRIGALGALVALLSSLTFFVLGRALAGRKGARQGGVLVGAIADFCSRSVYALAPSAGGLAVKSLLDAAAVPLKSLLGENVQFALIERLSGGVAGAGAGLRASVAELYLLREFLILLSRLAACAVTGFLFAFLAARGADPKLTARFLLAAAAPVSLLEFLFIKSFARANARAATIEKPTLFRI
jgi:hypothetical protein